LMLTTMMALFLQPLPYVSVFAVGLLGAFLSLRATLLLSLSAFLLDTLKEINVLIPMWGALHTLVNEALLMDGLPTMGFAEVVLLHNLLVAIPTQIVLSLAVRAFARALIALRPSLKV